MQPDKFITPTELGMNRSLLFLIEQYRYLETAAGLWIRIRIRIQLGLWIRIRIRNTDPDPDPGGQK
jgi:hypothetical protein